MDNHIYATILIDDHVLILKGLKELFNQHPQIRIDGMFVTPSDLDKYLVANEPEIVIADIQMPERNGFELCLYLKQRFPKIKVILLTMLDHLEYFQLAVKHGFDGYLLKSSSPDELLFGLQEIINGRKYYSNGLTQKYFHFINQEEQSLSSRELEVIRMLCNGMTNKEIAAKLFISSRTAEFHRANIFSKLNISGIAELVKYAIRHKIISIDL